MTIFTLLPIAESVSRSIILCNGGAFGGIAFSVFNARAVVAQYCKYHTFLDFYGIYRLRHGFCDKA